MRKTNLTPEDSKINITVLEYLHCNPAFASACNRYDLWKCVCLSVSSLCHSFHASCLLCPVCSLSLSTPMSASGTSPQGFATWRTKRRKRSACTRWVSWDKRPDCSMCSTHPSRARQACHSHLRRPSHILLNKDSVESKLNNSLRCTSDAVNWWFKK